MQLSPYLTFDGQCEAAFKFYEKCLGAKIEGIFPWEGSPGAEHVPAEWRSNKVMHARLVWENLELMGADIPPGQYQKPQGISVSIALKDPMRAERIFNSLAEKGVVQMPFEPTFWALRFGMLTDQFGIPWMINCEKED